jgi:hypothetical protein
MIASTAASADRCASGVQIVGGLFERCVDHIVAGGERLLRTAQALDRRERRLEAAHQRFTKLRITVETERASEAIRGRHRGADHAGQFVDPHGRRAKQIGQHVVAHTTMNRRESRHGRSDARGDGLLG